MPHGTARPERRSMRRHAIAIIGFWAGLLVLLAPPESVSAQRSLPRRDGQCRVAADRSPARHAEPIRPARLSPPLLRASPQQQAVGTHSTRCENPCCQARDAEPDSPCGRHRGNCRRCGSSRDHRPAGGSRQPRHQPALNRRFAGPARRDSRSGIALLRRARDDGGHILAGAAAGLVCDNSASPASGTGHIARVANERPAIATRGDSRRSAVRPYRAAVLAERLRRRAGLHALAAGLRAAAARPRLRRSCGSDFPSGGRAGAGHAR